MIKLKELIEKDMEVLYTYLKEEYNSKFIIEPYYCGNVVIKILDNKMNHEDIKNELELFYYENDIIFNDIVKVKSKNIQYVFYTITNYSKEYTIIIEEKIQALH